MGMPCWILLDDSMLINAEDVTIDRSSRHQHQRDNRKARPSDYTNMMWRHLAGQFEACRRSCINPRPWLMV